MASLAPFYAARNMYREFTNYKEPLTFEEWNKYPHNKKAALLYVQYFDQIVLAWGKANAFDFIDDDDGVSIIGQYLEKNVTKIENQPSRFKPGYIYTVAYNCMYCICHDLKSVKDRWENETSGIVIHDGQELSLFDTVPDQKGSAEETYLSGSFEDEFWRVIEDEGMSAEKVMRYLLSGDAVDLKKLSTRNKRYKIDPLRDVDVPVEYVESILSSLREKFLNLSSNSNCGRYIAQFQAAT